MRVNQKLFVILISLTFLPLLAVSFFIYLTSRSAIEEKVISNLEAIASIQESRVEYFVASNEDKLALVLNRFQIRRTLKHYLETQDPQDLVFINNVLTEAMSGVNSFERLMVMTPDGIVVGSTDKAFLGQNFSQTEIFQRGRVAKVTSIFLDSAAGGQEQLYLAGPLSLEGEFIGVAAIVVNIDELISLAADYTGLGETGETYIVRRNADGDTQFITPLRFEPTAPFKKIQPAAAPHIGTQALLGQEEVYTELYDYRGKRVIGITRYVSQADWGIVVKIDQDEAFREIRDLRRFLIIFMMALSVLLLFAIISIGRIINAPVLSLRDKLREYCEIEGCLPAGEAPSDELEFVSLSLQEMFNSLRRKNQELDKKVTELVKINSLMLGREAKMIEIKKENNAKVKNKANGRK